VTVDLDITDELKARALTGSDGASDLGVFYELDF
jgi:autotransporter translocation and assembly factor TamB